MDLLTEARDHIRAQCNICRLCPVSNDLLGRTNDLLARLDDALAQLDQQPDQAQPERQLDQPERQLALRATQLDHGQLDQPEARPTVAKKRGKNAGAAGSGRGQGPGGRPGARAARARSGLGTVAQKHNPPWGVS